MYLGFFEKDCFQFLKILLTPFRMGQGGGGGEQKNPPYQFFPCNFYRRKN